MIRLRHKLFIYALRLFDQLTLGVVLLVCLDQFGIYQGTGDLQYLSQNYYEPKAGIGLALLFLCWVWIFDVLVNYQTNRLKSLRTQIMDVFKADSASAFLLLLVGTAFSFKRINKDLILGFWLACCFVGILTRLIISTVLMFVRSSGYNYRHVLILGYNENALKLAKKIDDTPVLGYKITGFISDDSADVLKQDPSIKVRIIGQTKDLKEVLVDGPVDELMVCLPMQTHFATVSEAIRLSQELGVVLRLFPDEATAKILPRCHLEQFEGDFVVTFFREQLLLQLFGKRLMDIFISAAMLVLLSPLFLAVAVAIKVTSPGPVLFIQPRVGMNKRSFNLYKFRSMFIDAEKRKQELAHLNEMDGPVFKIKNDPRITPLGRFIRKTSIDELPQLVNVLTGHISLVGPRPPLLTEVDRYEWLYRRRLSTKPGITCLWQISGRNEVTFKQWMEMDQYYIDNWSLWLDIQILFKTVPAVLFRKGAS